jgi:hypothetical protein
MTIIPPDLLRLLNDNGWLTADQVTYLLKTKTRQHRHELTEGVQRYTFTAYRLPQVMSLPRVTRKKKTKSK